MECVEKLIKKDWINPLDNSKITEADIIPLQRVNIIYIILSCFYYINLSSNYLPSIIFNIVATGWNRICCSK